MHRLQVEFLTFFIYCLNNCLLNNNDRSDAKLTGIFVLCGSKSIRITFIYLFTSIFNGNLEPSPILV